MNLSKNYFHRTKRDKSGIIYKPYPTKEEFNKCNDYGYYVNGLLYSKQEYEKLFGNNGTK